MKCRSSTARLVALLSLFIGIEIGGTHILYFLQLFLDLLIELNLVLNLKLQKPLFTFVIDLSQLEIVALGAFLFKEALQPRLILLELLDAFLLLLDFLIKILLFLELSLHFLQLLLNNFIFFLQLIV